MGASHLDHVVDGRGHQALVIRRHNQARDGTQMRLKMLDKLNRRRHLFPELDVAVRRPRDQKLRGLGHRHVRHHVPVHERMLIRVRRRQVLQKCPLKWQFLGLFAVWRRRGRGGGRGRRRRRVARRDGHRSKVIIIVVVIVVVVGDGALPIIGHDGGVDIQVAYGKIPGIYSVGCRKRLLLPAACLLACWRAQSWRKTSRLKKPGKNVRALLAFFDIVGLE